MFTSCCCTHVLQGDLEVHPTDRRGPEAALRAIIEASATVVHVTANLREWLTMSAAEEETTPLKTTQAANFSADPMKVLMAPVGLAMLALGAACDALTEASNEAVAVQDKVQRAFPVEVIAYAAAHWGDIMSAATLLREVFKLSQEGSERIVEELSGSHEGSVALKELALAHELLFKMRHIRQGMAKTLFAFGKAWKAFPASDKQHLIGPLAHFVGKSHRLRRVSSLLPELDHIDCTAAFLELLGGLLNGSADELKLAATDFIASIKAHPLESTRLVTLSVAEFLLELIPVEARQWLQTKIIGRKVPIVGTTLVMISDMFAIAGAPSDWKTWAGMASTVLGACPGLGPAAAHFIDIAIIFGTIMGTVHHLCIDVPEDAQECTVPLESTHLAHNGKPIDKGSFVQLLRDVALSNAFDLARSRDPAVRVRASGVLSGEQSGWSEEKQQRSGQRAIVRTPWPDDTVTLQFADGQQLDFPDECVDVVDAWETFYSQHRGYINAGGDILVEKMTVDAAKSKSLLLPGCQGFSFYGEPTTGPLTIYFKDHCAAVHECAGWTTYKRETNLRDHHIQTREFVFV